MKGVRHAIPSFVFSADDDPGQPDAFLIDLAVRAVTFAITSDLREIADRDQAVGRYVMTWPGEHYRLLAGLVRALQPKTIIEIGTATGASALALLRYLPPGARLSTFDPIPWKQVPGSVLRESDFLDGRLVQLPDDLTGEEGFERHRSLLQSADLIFADAAKDGAMEQRFLDRILALPRDRRAVLLFDDTRVPNMLAIWRGLARPKLDLTSFGHWSGTGLTYVDATVTGEKPGT